MKAYTDVPQSERLVKILPLESADMYYREWKRMTKHIRIAHVGSAGENDLPCWSLAALLNLLPSEFTYYETTYEIQIRKYALTKGVDLHQIAYGSIKIDVDGHFSFKDMVNTGEKENLVDACYEMVTILKERNLL